MNPATTIKFGNKIEAELRDYQRLQAIGIKMPKTLDVDIEKERILNAMIIWRNGILKTGASNTGRKQQNF